MAEAAVRLADRLETEGPQPPAETQALLRWLADNHFTFLGYREYDLVEGEQGMALVPVPGTGLGILRHDKRGSASFAALPPEVRARAKDPQRLILTKANSRSTVHRRSYLDYIAIKRVNDSGEVVGEYRFLGLYTHEAYHESIARIPVLRRKLAEVLERSRRDTGQPRRQGPDRDPGGLPARGAVPDLGGRTDPRSRSGCCTCAPTRGPGCSCARTSTAGSCPAWCTCPGTGTPPAVRLRTQEILREALDGETVEYSATVGESPLARLLVVVRAKPGTALRRRGHRRPGGQDRRRGAVVGRGPRRRGHAQAGRRPGARAARPVRGRHPADLQDRRARPVRGERPDPDAEPAGLRRDQRVRPVGGRRVRRRPAHGRRQARRVAAHHLPGGHAHHAHRRAAAVAAHGRGRGRRAPLRVRRAAGAAVLDL